ncbi:hypothetical protein D5S17_11280 [Pseudonocardiaceae bacterium YIM PH 21723]|nr:hypothetical protein D5S17_11280 [Pseudonocardiaceae bacterium YIM PH 21723]
MNPSASGRRHERADSITVAELLEKQHATGTRELPRIVLPDPDHLEFGEDAELEEDGPSGPMARWMRGAGVLACCLTLCGSVAAAAMITNAPPGDEARSVPVNSPGLTDAQALRPDWLTGEQPQQPAAPAVSTSPAGVAPTTTTSQKPQPGGLLPGVQLPVGAAAIELVNRFYGLLPLDPRAAFALLEPNLLGPDPLGLIGSWRAVRAVQPDNVRLDPGDPNSVLATVRVQQADGSWVLMDHVFTLSESKPQRILHLTVKSIQKLK